MIYVPIIKNRRAELLAIGKCVECFGKSIIPFFEIIDNQYNTRYKLNSKGERILELKPGNKKHTPVKLENTEEDICTLDKIDSIVGHNRCFIEYFRYSDDEYPDSKIDLSKVKLARELSFNYMKYADSTVSICDYENFIPIISIKKGFKISDSDLISLIERIREKGHIFGIRIQIELFDDYQAIMEETLEKDDYLFVDIGESPYKSQVFLLQDVETVGIKAKSILINSPRHRKDIKKEYKKDGWEPLINNDVAKKFSECGFCGFGDYAGLKDTLPENVPVRSVILALLYSKDKNEFWSIKSQKKGDGAEVKRMALEHSDIFDIEGTCRGYREINRIEKGSQMNWNEITVIRYIDQISRIVAG